METLYIARYFDTVDTIQMFKRMGLMSTTDVILFDSYFTSKAKAIDQLRIYSMLMLKYHLSHQSVERDQRVVLEEWVSSEGRYTLSSLNCYAERKERVYHDYSSNKAFETL